MSSDEWQPFIQAFNKVTVLARVEPGTVSDDGYLIDEALEVVPIPYYSGIANFLSNRRKVLNFMSTYVKGSDNVYYIWLPNSFAPTIIKKIKKVSAPLMLRVIGDPSGVAKAILPFPFNRLIAPLQSAQLRKTVKFGDGVLYVTLNTLQRLYPARRDAVVQARTDVVFSPELLAIPKKQDNHDTRPFSVIAVGSQNQNYKGHDLLIKAVARLQRTGFDVSLTLVGQGAMHQELKQLAQEVGIEKVSFVERLGSSLDVARYVSTFDLFAMPSRTEGMPKALLEAMAVGVLSIGSTVGGIPEVLEDECLFPPNSVTGLEEKIASFMNNWDLAEQQRRLQAENIALIRKKYSGSKVVERFLETFLEEKVSN
jgi:glycosyltransferase involved in cell wall biosynthesis